MIGCSYNELDKYLKGVWEFECESNKIKCPVNKFKPCSDDVIRFNTVYQLVKDFEEIKATASGSVSKKSLPTFGICHIVSSNSVEIVVKCGKRWYRLIFKNYYVLDDGSIIEGRKAFNSFKKEVKNQGGDLDKLSIPNGKQVKASIMQESDNELDKNGRRKCFDIWLNPEFEGRTVYNAHHVDINSAFMAGIAQNYGHELDGALGRAIHKVYSERKLPQRRALYKAILNCSQGFMQSRWCNINGHGYALAHLSKSGIEFCYDKLQKIKKLFIKLGYDLIATNTDGVWVVSNTWRSREELERLLGCSDELGKFRFDHFGCKLRYKSAGAYEFVEDGVYHAVVRGKTKLDSIKPRDKWNWGDIYQEDANIIGYKFIKGVGVVADEKK